MRETAAILLIVWLAGLLMSRTFNGLLHVLPLLALVLVVLSLWSGRRRRSAGSAGIGGGA